MSKRTPGLKKRSKANGCYEWHVDKRIKGYGRLCESTGSSDEEEAGRYLTRRLEEIRQAIVYGVRPRRKFRVAAAKYLTDFATKKRGIKRDALALKDMDPFIGDEWLDEIHNDSFDEYKRKRSHLSMGTINRNLRVVTRILDLCARLWRDKGAKVTWLAQAPMILIDDNYPKRKPYPLDWEEQTLLFSELAPHLERMAMFKANCGPREREVCRLKWSWERRMPELETDGKPRSVFLLPANVTKNGEDRVLILNDVAQSIVEEMRGQHPEYVFTYENLKRKRKRGPLDRMHSSGWRAARKRAAEQYKEVFGRECPDGFRRFRMHDLRHTYGRRLRAAGVGLEDRRDLLGHKGGSVTTDYSAAEIGNLIESANRTIRSRKSHAMTILRVLPDRVSA